MTTFTAFNPQPDAPFQFQPTLDGQLYTATVIWNLFGQRWYVNLVDQGGNLVFLLPLIGSQSLQEATTLGWANGVVTVIAAGALPYPVGTLANLTIYNSQPTAYNGAFQCTIISPISFTYSLAADPGAVTTIGAFAEDISLTAGYFASTLIYRPTTGNFEVSP